MKNFWLFFILLLLVSLQVKAQRTYSYLYTKVVEANGIMKKGGEPNDYKYFTFNKNVVYESDEYGNATQVGQCYAYFFIGKQGDTMIFEERSLLDPKNPFIVNMENVARNFSGIYSTKMLVSCDFKTLNICNYDKNNKLVRTHVYNQANPHRLEPAEIPELIK